MTPDFETHYRTGFENCEGPANMPSMLLGKYDRKLSEGREQQWHFLPICVSAYRAQQSGTPEAEVPGFDALTEIERAAIQMMDMLLREGPGEIHRLIDVEVVGKGVMHDMHVTFDSATFFISHAVDSTVFRRKDGTFAVECHADVTHKFEPVTVPWGVELIKCYHEIWPHIPDPSIFD